MTRSRKKTVRYWLLRIVLVALLALLALAACVWAALVITYEYYDGDYPPTPTQESMTPKETMAFAVRPGAIGTFFVLAAIQLYQLVRIISAFLRPDPDLEPPKQF